MIPVERGQVIGGALMGGVSGFVFSKPAISAILKANPHLSPGGGVKGVIASMGIAALAGAGLGAGAGLASGYHEAVNMRNYRSNLRQHLFAAHNNPTLSNQVGVLSATRPETPGIMSHLLAQAQSRIDQSLEKSVPEMASDRFTRMLGDYNPGLQLNPVPKQ